MAVNKYSKVSYKTLVQKTLLRINFCLLPVVLGIFENLLNLGCSSENSDMKLSCSNAMKIGTCTGTHSNLFGVHDLE